jgi:uncharacterized protein with HEPN domain
MSDEKRDYTLFIDDILEAIEKVERYAADSTFEDFSCNEMAVDAVIRNFEVIGEAARNMPEEIKKKYPYVEWKEMIGFRNVLIHEYFGIEIESVWDTVRKNIPELKKHILEMKADYERTTDS